MAAMLIGPQIRAGRVLLGWSTQTLADRARVGVRTVKRAERVGGVPSMHTDTMAAIQRALEQGGVEFIDANTQHGPGVRLRRSP